MAVEEGAMADLYFEDFKIGDRFVSAGITVSESMILEFALRYDPQPFHLDIEAAKESHYGGLIASGFQTMALGFRAFLDLGVFRACGMGSPGRGHHPQRAHHCRNPSASLEARSRFADDG